MTAVARPCTSDLDCIDHDACDRCVGSRASRRRT